MAELGNRAVKEAQRRIQELKWLELAKRGITPPRDEKERQKRLKDAHGGT